MRPTHALCGAFLALAFLTPVSRADEPIDLRRNDPIVKAVGKSIHSVVAIRVPRPGEKDMIGSGVIVTESGLIVTNRHVTAGKRLVKVRLNDGSETTGEVVVADADLDLAVVRITSKKTLQALTLGSKDDLLLAEKVIAIGSPYGYEGTVSVGIISALNREIYMPNDVLMTGLIQHNAAINPGNSGGPLININGKVIGINVAMRDGAQNIAFAINAGVVTEFLTKNFNAKRIAGIEHGMNCENRIAAKLVDPQCVVVKNAAHDLEAGDKILRVGDLKVANTFDVERALWHKKPGQRIEVQIVRQGKEVAVTLTLEASQGAGQVAAVARPTASNTIATTNVRSANER